MSKLKVMLVDECSERAELVAQMLTSIDCELIAMLEPPANLLEEVVEHQPDIVIIDLDSPGRDILESLRQVRERQPRPMVMFSQDDAEATIREAVEAGVSAYVVDGIQGKKVRPILDAAIARFRQFRNLETELEKTRGQLKDRKTIDRAKGILMQQRQLDEETAYQLLRKTAMSKNKKVVDIAEGIVAAAELLNP